MSNLKITNGTTANSQMTITADILTLNATAGGVAPVVGVNVTINSGTAGANGIDTGTVGASHWYYLYVINNGTTTAGLMSLSATAPTLPSGYTLFTRVGAVKTDASSHLLRVLQLGKQCRYQVTPSTNTAAYPSVATGPNGSGSAGGLVPIAISGFAPATAALVYYAGGTILQAATDNGVMIAPNNNFGAEGDGTNPVPLLSGAIDGSCYGGLQPESANVYVGTDTNSYIVCCGWEDNF